MLRPALATLAILALAAASLATGLPADEAPSARVKPIGQVILEQRAHFASQHANHPEEMPLPAVDPAVEARRVIAEQPFLGRTPYEWVQASTAERLLSLQPASAPQARDLVAEVLRIEAALGIAARPADVLSMRAQAAALPAEVRGPFAELVGTVADAYVPQALLAKDVVSRIGLTEEERPYLTQEERDATILRAEAILAAQNRFRDAVSTYLEMPQATPLIFSDPEGLVVLGGLGHDTYTRNGSIKDPVVLVDLSGNDTYLNSAGGACALNFIALSGVDCNLLAVSVLVDLAGDDVYSYSGLPSVVQGAGGYGGLGVLVDVAGSDQYLSTMVRANQDAFFAYIDGGAQGYGQIGVGYLVDGTGNDLYRADVRSTQGWDIWDFTQGFGGAGGHGVAADGAGNDRWLSNGLGLTGAGFQGVYSNGVGFYGGVGVMADTGRGNDEYTATNVAQTTDYYAQGFGAFGGLGIFYEDGGDDDYSATQSASNPFIIPLLNCAFGTGSAGGMGVFIEVTGHDTYYGDSFSPFAAETMNEGMGDIIAGYGLFVDLSGDDGHFMYAHGGPGSATAGRGVLLQGGVNKNIAGTFLDYNGADTYVGAPPSGDGKAWIAGADVNGPKVLLNDFLFG